MPKDYQVSVVNFVNVSRSQEFGFNGFHFFFHFNRDHNSIDVNAVYHQLNATYKSDSDDLEAGPSSGPRTPAGCRRCDFIAIPPLYGKHWRPDVMINRFFLVSHRSVRNKRTSNSGGGSGGDWRTKCRKVLDIIWHNPDSAPFREPVDTIEHPDYLQIIDTPMDLMTIKEDLLGGNYQSPQIFLKDMRLVFSNSRAYNTNTRSRVSGIF